MFRVGLPEVLIILMILALMFGGSKLPEFARGLGRGIRNFKDASREDADHKKESA